MNFKHKYFFLFPGLFVLIGILIFPIIFVVRLSLSGWNSYNPGLDYIGLENYIRLFTDDPRFWESFFRLSFLSVTTVILQYIIGFALAHMVWKDIKFKRFFRVLFLVPMMTTPVIMTVIWRTFFHESLGPVNDLLSIFGVAPKWLTDPVVAKFTVIIVEVWQWTPFMFLLLLAGLLSLPKEPFLAAALIKSAVKAKPGKIYNLGSGKETSVNTIANIIGGKKVYIPKRPGEPDRSLADISKIKKELNWKPTINIHDGVRELMKIINNWKNAPVWTPKSIKKATRVWFKELGKKK